MTRRIAFLFGNEPNPLHLERMECLQKSGTYQPLFVYWQRGQSSITIPYSSNITSDSFVPIHLPDPRGNLLRRAALSLLFTLRVALVMHRLKPHIVHPVNVDMLGIAALALIGRHRVALAYDLQEQIGEKLNPVYRFFYRLFLKRNDVTFIHFEGGRLFLRANNLESYAMPIVRICAGPLNMPLVQQIANAPNNTWPELVIGYYGYLRGRRQIVALIEAAKKLNHEGKKVVVDFGGTGDEAEFVQQQANHYEFVHFQGAFDYTKSHLSMYMSADVIFAVFPQSVPNYRNHYARRFCEGVVSGKPVIVARGSAMGQFVQKWGGGWEVEEDSAEDIAQVISRVFADRGMLRSKVPDKVRAEFSFKTYVNQYLAALDAAANKRNR